MNDMNDILFEALKAVLILAVILFTRYAVPWMKQAVENTKYNWIVKWVGIAVRSAEQTIFGDKRGEERKAVVTQFIKEQLINKNIALSDRQVDALIEAAVFAMNGGR